MADGAASNQRRFNFSLPPATSALRPGEIVVDLFAGGGGASARSIAIHAARVHLAEAARRRNHPANRDFYWTLLQWARNARLRAAAATERDLFGAIA